MDSQHLRARSTAFRRAVVAAPNEGVREDAMARLVEALEALTIARHAKKSKNATLRVTPRGSTRPPSSAVPVIPKSPSS